MFLLYIIEYLGKEIPENAVSIVNQSFNIFILLLVLLFSIINIIGYLLSIILIQKYKDNITVKYRFLRRMISFYLNRTIFFLIFEVGLVFSIIIFLMWYYYSIIISNIN
jgi:hypothetical protein